MNGRHTGALVAIAIVLLPFGASARQQPNPPPLDLPIFDNLNAFVQEGRAAKRLARMLAETPTDPALPSLLAWHGRLDDALRFLREVVDERPHDIARAFTVPSLQFTLDAARSYGDQLRDLVTKAKARLVDLPREDAARAARVLLSLENGLNRGGSAGWADQLRGFVTEYAGTAAALLAEVDLISVGRLSEAQFAALDEFARRHPGTVAAAKAVYEKGYDLAHNGSALRMEPPNGDPSPRFQRVLEVVRELQSGKYPRCEWVDRAPELVTGFFISDRMTFAPGNLDAMIAAHIDAAKDGWSADPAALAGSNIAYVLTGKLDRLFRLRGDRIVGVERVLAELTKTTATPDAVRMLLADFYLQNLIEIPAEREQLIAKALPILDVVRRNGVEPFARRALATRATLMFHERRYAEARDAQREYLAKYPSSDYTWIAALRLGQSLLELGDIDAAAAQFASAARTYSEIPPAQVAGHAWAADAFLGLGRVGDAVEHLRRALSAWDADYGTTYRVHAAQARRPGDEPFTGTEHLNLVKHQLAERLVDLGTLARVPGAGAIAQARWLADRRRFSEARDVLARGARERRGADAEARATALQARIGLEEALDLADVSTSKSDRRAALAALDPLLDAPGYTAVAAGIARATLLAQDGAPNAADAMTTTLAEWRVRQPRSDPPTPGTLEADLAAIRTIVFQPRGGGIFADPALPGAKSASNWNAFEWPKTDSPFLLVNPDITVKQHDGAISRVTLRQPIASFDNVLFVDTEQLGVLTLLMRKLGGTARRAPTQVMQTPNQPVGPSLDIRAFWNRFFPMRPGHWGGWEFDAFPRITEVAFHDAARTRAAVRVTIGYSGCIVVLAKENGVWVAKEFVGFWIT